MIGESAFALRLMSLMFSVLTCFLWTWSVRRLFGNRAMTLTGLLLIMSPVYYSRLTVIAWGNHAESGFPSAVAIAAITLLWGSTTGLTASTRSSRTRTLAFIAGLAATGGLFSPMLRLSS